jgi:hypothetical protein
MATDTNGYQQSVSEDVGPQISQLAFATVPTGLQLLLDGQPLATTTSVPAIVGMGRLLTAPSPQTQNGSNYQFVVWSDGGPASHYISVPDTNAAFTASYVQPSLGLSAVAGNIELSWPDWAAAMHVYSTPDLTPPVSWSRITNAPTLSQGSFTLQVTPTNRIQFYRLQLQ